MNDAVMSVQAIRLAFVNRFGIEPNIFAVSPGRINLIGEHTDYNDGFVFPAAIDRGLTIAARITDGPTQTFSLQLGEGDEFNTTEVKPGFTTSWSKYSAGMNWALTQSTSKPLPNLIAVVDSNIPIGSGVSSSAALELAFGVVWNELADLGLTNQELAKLGQVCENKFVGVNSGIMDQMACALGKDAMAIFLDTRTLEIQYAPVPEGLSIVLCDTKKERALTSSAYNERRSQCEQACECMGVAKLRDASLQDLELARSKMSEVVYRRAKHVITENQRCLDFKDALASGNLKEIGELMKASHESLRWDYEVSCPELDAMAEAAWTSPGCVGARMTGAGFGGACVAMVQTSELDAFTSNLLAQYHATTGRIGEAMACNIVDGSRVLKA